MLNNLKSLKTLVPDQRFLAHSRHLILSTAKPTPSIPFFTRALYLAGAFSLALLLVYITAGPPAGGPAPILTEVKEKNPEFNIELANAKYFKEVAPNVYVVVMEDK